MQNNIYCVSIVRIAIRMSNVLDRWLYTYLGMLKNPNFSRLNPLVWQEHCIETFSKKKIQSEFQLFLSLTCIFLQVFHACLLAAEYQ